MHESIAPNVRPEKLYPLLRKADADQLATLYRLAHHIIRGRLPEGGSGSAEQMLHLFREGTNRQRLLIFQAAYHLIRKRMP